MLFKKLNEQIEINNAVSNEPTEAEKQKVEKDILFNSLLEDIIQDLKISEAKNA